MRRHRRLRWVAAINGGCFFHTRLLDRDGGFLAFF
jgi:hypothetical protein